MAGSVGSYTKQKKKKKKPVIVDETVSIDRRNSLEIKSLLNFSCYLEGIKKGRTQHNSIRNPSNNTPS